MSEEAPFDLTSMLQRAADGHEDAMDRVVEHVYEDLRRIARRRMQQGGFPEATLEPTALVHETFLRLRQQQSEFKNRKHFFAVATRIMMRALIDYQRAKRSERRGGDQIRLTLSRLQPEAGQPDAVDMAALSEALDELGGLDPRKAEVVQLYVLWGFEMTEIADLLEVSTRTVERDWKFSRAWLADRLDV